MPSIPGFRFGDELHLSAHSSVHRATHLHDGRAVIVKALTQEYPPPRRVAAFRREFEVVEELAARGVGGVVRPLRFLGQGKDVAMVFDYLPGLSLDQHIPSGGLPLAEALRLGARLARTLGDVHGAGFVHRDVKPANVVVDPPSGDSWLIDFGISSSLRSVQGRAGRLEGSIAYMSPEQTGRMNRPVDHRSDFYSLGATLYQALSGQRPFLASDPLELVHAHIALEPVPLHVLRPDIPRPVSRLIARLLSKAAEDRYQGAGGLVADLDALVDALERGGIPDDFVLCAHDVPEDFQLPSRLYGREAELASLMAHFQRASEGSSELLLVSGYSGVGKSALIREVHKPIVRSRGYFIAGKFDQFKRNIPYASVIEAFGDLVQQLLTESAERIAAWKQAILGALGGIAGVACEVLPELELVIGPQARAPELSGEAAQNRLNRTFVALVDVFASVEHPLVLFLDDLQWADRPTLQLLRLLATEADIGHLMVIGCYRDNEVDASHPLTLTLEAVARQRATAGLEPVARVHLEGLAAPVLSQLLGDCLRIPAGETEPLAALIHDKTAGNPFFVNQFLSVLCDDGLFRFEAGRGAFQLEEIRARDITDNVVELMTEKIGLLEAETRATLRLAAAVGSVFELQTLASSGGQSASAAAAALWPALAGGLVVPLDEDYRLVGGGEARGLNPRYRFLHDRVQQAAYAMIPQAGRAAIHLRIGRAMLELLDEEGLDDRLFTVVDQLASGLDEIPAGDAVELGALFARAGDKARLASAHEPALKYFGAAQRLLGDALWDEHYDIGQPVVFQRSASEYLLGNFDAAEALFDQLVARSRTDLEKAQVYRLKLSLYQSRGLFLETVDIAYRGLAHLGVQLPRDPGQATFLAELAKFKWKLRGKSEEDLKQLPLCTDPAVITALDIMNDFSGPAFFVDINIYLCVVLTMCSLSLEHGNAPESAYCWTLYGMMNGPIMGNVPHGMELGRVGEHVDATHRKASLIPKVALSLGGLVYQWGQHPRLSIPYFEKGFKAALESGDPTHAGYCANFMVCMFSVIGEPLEVIDVTTSRFIDFAQKNQIEVQSEIQVVERQMARALMGRTERPTSWDDAEVGFDEAAWLAAARTFQSRQPLHNYLIEKQATLYLAGAFAHAAAMGDEAATMLDVSLGIPIFSNFHLFYGLTNAQLVEQRPRARGRLRKMLKQHRKWARHNPDGFEHKRLLLEGELARVQGRAAAAEEHYEQAITQAAQQGFVHHEAIAHELAGRHYLARGRERLARLSLREARHAFGRWGAQAVVRRLDAEFPDLGSTITSPSTQTEQTLTATREDSASSLDLETIVRVSQLISREIVLAELLEKLMKLLLESAGAQRAVLLLRDKRGLLVQAEQLVGFAATVLQATPASGREDLAHGVINRVERTGEAVVIDDVTAAGGFEKDRRLETRRGSLLCAPIVHGGAVTGLIYLENELVPGAFTPARLELLRLLSSQIAISIENAEHYRRAERTAAAFARFVPQQFFEFLGRDAIVDVALGDAVQRDMTVLFADIRSFTAVSEGMSPSENMAFLNEYLQQVSPVIRAHGGFVDKYIGDAVMALFPGDPADAVRAAIAMHQEVDRLNEARVERGDAPIRIGVGVHHGTLMLGTIGETERMDSTVISDAVNICARLEGLTKRYGAPILVSGSTLALCGEASFSQRYLGTVRPRGRASRVALYEIYDPLSAHAVGLRDSTRGELEAAVRQLEADETDEARAGLKLVLASDPGDRAAQYLLKRLG